MSTTNSPTASASSPLDITFDDLERAFDDAALEPAGGDATPAPPIDPTLPVASTASSAPPELTATPFPATTQLATPLPNRPTRTLRARVSHASVEPWPPPVPDDYVWPESPGGSGRLVVVLKLEDGTTAYSVIYGHPVWPDRTVEPLRSFGWHGERDPGGQPVPTAAQLEVVVQSQFQLGFGDVQTVLSVSVVDPNPERDVLVPPETAFSTQETSP